MEARVEKITDQDFNLRVLESQGPSVVDFWATWCKPCRQLDEVLEEVAERYSGKVTFFRVDVNESSGTASRYSVFSIPTLLFFQGGEVVDHAVGALSREAILEKVDKLLAAG
jgi:thioredoxin 1